MATAEITIQFLNPQKLGKKNASVKADDGQLYLVPPEMFHLFSQGSRYKIEYKTSTFNGVTFRFVEKVEAATGAAPAGTAAPRSAGKYGATDDVTAERIFVCGGLNAMLNNSNATSFTASKEDLLERVEALRWVWNNSFGRPKPRDDMDDSNPF